MMARCVLNSLLVVALCTVASARVVFEAREAAPRQWERHQEKVEAGTTLMLSVFLKIPETSASRLAAEMLDRADPASSLYGQWLSNDEVHDMVRPAPGAIEAVEEFLVEHGAASVEWGSPNGDILKARVSVAQAEKMLDAEFFRFSRRGSDVSLVRCLKYSLPEDVAKHVALVGPTTRFPTPQAPKVLPKAPGATYSNDPTNLRALYNVNDVYGGAAGSANRQAVTAFLAQYFSQSDLDRFWAHEFPEGSAVNLTFVGDATTGVPAGVESMLDIEYMPSLGALIDTGFWGFSGSSPNNDEDEPFLTWLQTVDNTSDAEVPLVFSTSYGEDESWEVPTDYSDRINTEFVKCGARGISLLFASGDSGAAGDEGGCVDDQFVPMWPAGSPYVTAVGGTQLGALPEEAWPYSSGGFSNVFETPSWQSNFTSLFVTTTGPASGSMPDSSLFNASGRGFPDISAQAVNFPVWVDHTELPTVGGTSCASPTSGGVFGLLNDARIAAGKSSLGFLNPMLYANPDALNDCTSGLQNGCSATVKGFPAVDGWDAVTGLGSPDYTALLDVVMALP